MKYLKEFNESASYKGLETLLKDVKDAFAYIIDDEGAYVTTSQDGTFDKNGDFIPSDIHEKDSEDVGISISFYIGAQSDDCDDDDIKDMDELISVRESRLEFLKDINSNLNQLKTTRPEYSNLVIDLIVNGDEIELILTPIDVEYHDFYEKRGNNTIFIDSSKFRKFLNLKNGVKFRLYRDKFTFIFDGNEEFELYCKGLLINRHGYNDMSIGSLVKDLKVNGDILFKEIYGVKKGEKVRYYSGGGEGSRTVWEIIFTLNPKYKYGIK